MVFDRFQELHRGRISDSGRVLGLQAAASASARNPQSSSSLPSLTPEQKPIQASLQRGALELQAAASAKMSLTTMQLEHVASFQQHQSSSTTNVEADDDEEIQMVPLSPKEEPPSSSSPSPHSFEFHTSANAELVIHKFCMIEASGVG